MGDVLSGDQDGRRGRSDLSVRTKWTQYSQSGLNPAANDACRDSGAAKCHKVGQTFRAEQTLSTAIWLPIESNEEQERTNAFAFHLASTGRCARIPTALRLWRPLLLIVLGAFVRF